MTYLHLLVVIGYYVIVVAGAMAGIVTGLLMFFAIGELFEGEWRTTATVWLIGFPILFFGGPAWYLLTLNTPS